MKFNVCSTLVNMRWMVCPVVRLYFRLFGRTLLLSGVLHVAIMIFCSVNENTLLICM